MSNAELLPSRTPTQALAQGLSRRYNDTLTDFRIKCGEREWKVHRVVLAIHSDVFAAACTKNFKEATTGFIDLSQDDPRCIDALVSYLYNLAYDDCCESGSTDVLDFNVRMCILADKYDIPPLKLLAGSKFRQAAVHANPLRTALAKAAVRAYDAPQPTRSIRQDIIQLVVDYDILATVNSECEFERVMRQCGEFATDVAKAQRAHSKPLYKRISKMTYRCPRCSTPREFSAFEPSTNPHGTFLCATCCCTFMGFKWQL